VADAQSLDPANLAAEQLRAQLAAALPELATQAAPPASTAEPAPEAAPAELPEPPNMVEAKTTGPPAADPPEPAPARPEAYAPLEPPSFWQFEDDLRLSQRPHRRECGTEPELLSILNPAPAPPEEPNFRIASAIPGIIAAVIAVLVGTVFSSSSHHGRAPSTEFASPAGSAADDRVYRAGSEVTAPIFLSRPEPEYTEEALGAQLQGTVVLYAQIDPSGNAVNLHVLRGLGMGLDARAIEAASKWRFRPGMRNGTPVTVETNLEVNFRLP
jgi:TonB family protein